MFGSQKPDPDLEIFTVYDSKVGVYRPPMYSINQFALLREFQTQIFMDPSQSRNELFTNPEDFQIFKIGEYSRRTGTITPCQPKHVANLHELKTAVQRSNPSQDSRNVTPLGIVST